MRRSKRLGRVTPETDSPSWLPKSASSRNVLSTPRDRSRRSSTRSRTTRTRRSWPPSRAPGTRSPSPSSWRTPAACGTRRSRRGSSRRERPTRWPLRSSRSAMRQTSSQRSRSDAHRRPSASSTSPASWTRCSRRSSAAATGGSAFARASRSSRRPPKRGHRFRGSGGRAVCHPVDTTGMTPAELASEHERRSARAALGPRELADLHALDFIDLRATQVDRLAAEMLPLDLLVRSGAIPFRIVDGRLKVAISDPRDIAITDELRLVSNNPLDFAVASPLDIEFELRLLARAHEVGERAAVIEDVLPGSIEEHGDLDTDGPSDAPPIRLVNSIVVQAIEDRASDLHFLPQGDSLVARLRVDGIMHEVERIPKRHAAGVISRVKVLAKLDIAEHRLPQDGRFTLRPKGREALLEVRVAIVPTVEGEGAILRLLDKSRRSPTLTEVGLSNEMQMRLEEI